MNQNESEKKDRFEKSKEQKKIAEQKLKADANKVIMVLREEASGSDDRNPIPASKLAEQSGLTEPRLHLVIKYMRRCSETNLERYIPYYPISSKQGYFLPRTWSDFEPFYITMFKWYKSLERTIEPCRLKMEKEKINYLETMAEMEDMDLDNYLSSVTVGNLAQMDKNTSWFLDE